jgi:hypothetical protein
MEKKNGKIKMPPPEFRVKWKTKANNHHNEYATLYTHTYHFCNPHTYTPAAAGSCLFIYICIHVIFTNVIFSHSYRRVSLSLAPKSLRMENNVHVVESAPSEFEFLFFVFSFRGFFLQFLFLISFVICYKVPAWKQSGALEWLNSASLAFITVNHRHQLTLEKEKKKKE